MAHNTKEIIANLTGAQARTVLGRLAGRRGTVTKAVSEEVLRVVEIVDVEKIGTSLWHSLECIDVEDCWDRSGKQRYGGYVSPDDAAFDLIEEALFPFRQELKKYIDLQFPLQAEAYCRGIIRGLYRFEYESHTDFTDWCAEIPESCADSIMHEWKKSIHPGTDTSPMDEFFQDLCPDWEFLYK